MQVPTAMCTLVSSFLYQHICTTTLKDGKNIHIVVQVKVECSADTSVQYGPQVQILNYTE
jgi:hypothetical protein